MSSHDYSLYLIQVTIKATASLTPNEHDINISYVIVTTVWYHGKWTTIGEHGVGTWNLGLTWSRQKNIGGQLTLDIERTCTLLSPY